MKPIELHIFYLTEDQNTLAEIGLVIEYDDFDKFELRPETFYHINSIAPYRHNGEYKYTKIFANGNYCICNLPYKELKRKIEEI